MKTLRHSVELLAPAGDMASARAAFANGADAVYLGLKKFSARAGAENFTEEELRAAVGLARSFTPRKKIYVAVNTLVDDADMEEAARDLQIASSAGADGVIVQDLGVARICRGMFPNLELHASTQLTAHNLEGVLALKERGFRRVVLAREIPLKDVRTVAERCGVEIEVFVHGALCYSISGLCLFSAMAHARSGNRGECAYCCRAAYENEEGRRLLPFSMRDLRLADDLEELKASGAASLKIEGRMKSALYVGAVTKFYRERLDGAQVHTVAQEDLETIFSRRTTTLYAHGFDDGAEKTDPANRTHLGAEIGTVKRLTKDRQGRVWMRFHTRRAIERHDGLQFVVDQEERPAGFGIGAMRLAIARRNVFEAPAGSDVEVEVPKGELQNVLHGGLAVYCGHSEAVKRRFSPPGPARAETLLAGEEIDIEVQLKPDGVRAKCEGAEVFHAATLDKAANPAKTQEAVKAAFSRWGGTRWLARRVEVKDDERLFAPAAVLNAARRELGEALEKRGKEFLLPQMSVPEAAAPVRSLKIRLEQWTENAGEGFDETVVRIGAGTKFADAARLPRGTRIALPVWTREDDCGVLRTLVKRLMHGGFAKWEAGDAAALRMLKALGAEDVTADWTLYAANRAALAELREMGAKTVVASPEMREENRKAMENALVQLEEITPPLFISLTKPEGGLGFRDAKRELEVFRTDGLWVTTDGRRIRRAFPEGVATRCDRSWRKDCDAWA